MSDLADRINTMAFELIEHACTELVVAGAPDATVDQEVITALCLAYAISCQVKGYTYDQVEPIIRRAFEAPRKIASMNAKGGAA